MGRDHRLAIPLAVLPSSLRRIGVAFLDDAAAGKRGDLPLHQRASGDQRSEPGQAGAGHGLARQLEPATWSMAADTSCWLVTVSAMVVAAPICGMTVNVTVT